MLSLARVESLGDALRDATLAYPSNVALYEANRHREAVCLRYAELREAAERFAGGLQALGLDAGARCAILMSNQSRWVIGGLGALWAGAVLVPLDFKLTPDEQAALLRHARPRVLVTEYPVWRGLAEVLGDDLPELEVLVSEAPAGADLGRGRRWEALPESSWQPVARRREDVCCIVYSSGTGGEPKGCMLTHANYLAQAEVLGNLYPMEEGDRYFSILPTNHAIDFMCGMIVPFLFGAAVVHQRTLRPEFLMATLKRYGITHMALVPRLLKVLEGRVRERIEQLPDWQRLVLESLIGVHEVATARKPKPRLSRWMLAPLHEPFGSRLRLIFCGGAFVEPGAAAFFNRIGLPVVIGYGLTEACTVITLNDLQPFRADTVGRPLPGLEVVLRDRNDAGVGEVYVRGPTVMKGYLDAPDLTRAALDGEGWLRTGDLAVFDAAGHLKLVGRAKNMIVTEGGKNVYPEDVEAAFDGVPGCHEHCVFAERYIWPEQGLGQDRLVVVARADEDAADRSALIEALAQRNRKLADYKRLGAVVWWHEAFPRTASLKIKRELLAQQLREALSRDAALQPLEEGVRRAS